METAESWNVTCEEHCIPPEDGNSLSTAKSDNCISNCGMDIVNNDTPPLDFISVAYFEVWNAERLCLWMDVDDVDTSRFTHVHYAFAELTDELAVKINSTQDQFNRFVNMSDIKRVLSFGSWTDSTDREWYDTIRKGEYPEYPDASGADNEDPTDGDMYLEFLSVLHEVLPSDKSLPIAAPASHWFLRGFPQIDQMSEYLDYIVYMTYDLHGQWDWGSNSSQSGCPDGNCLRSHVNITETMNALFIITKAGVMSNKAVVGVTSYGRSFRMTEEGCTGSECAYVGGG